MTITIVEVQPVAGLTAQTPSVANCGDVFKIMYRHACSTRDEDSPTFTVAQLINSGASVYGATFVTLRSLYNCFDKYQRDAFCAAFYDYVTANKRGAHGAILVPHEKNTDPQVQGYDCTEKET